MNRKIVTILIFSMCFALCGIVFIQVYWISSTVRMANEEFNLQVNGALNNVSKKLEQMEEVKFAQNRFVLADSTDESHADKKQTKAKKNKRGPRIYLKYQMIDSSYITAHGVIKNSVNKTEKIIRNDSSFHTNTSLMIVKTDEEKINRKADGIVDAIKKLINENQHAKEGLAERIPLGLLYPLIKSELSNSGINLAFDFKVNSGGPMDTIIYQSASLPDSHENASYSIALFPNDLAPQNGKLVLLIANRNAHIIRAMQGMLLLSLLFTLVIIFIFYYTVRIIIKQKKLSEIKNDFINNMTHEFKTPIATISLAVDAVNNPQVLHDEEKLRYYSGIIKEENKRMNAQVEKVLQVALTERNDFELHRQNLDLHEVIRQALSNFEFQLTQNNAGITSNLKAGNSILNGDEFHLLHAISNIIDNAIKYSASPAVISIETWNEENNLFIKISDKGTGMSKETQKKIFDKFYRAQSGNIHDVKGFGLGLSYAKNIFEKHYGTIKVDSESNKGSAFTITFKQDTDG